METTEKTYLKDHAAELSGEQKLLALADQRVDGEVLLHIIAAGHHAVDTKSGVLFLDLARLDGGQSLDGAQTRVLGQSHGNGIKSIGKCAHGVLLNTWAL